MSQRVKAKPGKKNKREPMKPRTKKVNVKQAIKNSTPSRALKQDGGRGTDLRAAVSDYGRPENIEPTQDSIISTALLDYGTVRSLALGPVLEALRRGWKTLNGYPFYAARYLYDSFKAVFLGTFPTISSAPRWFWVVCDAIYPKDARFKTGSIQYNWEFTGLDDFSSTTVMDGVTVVFGTPSVNSINGLSVLDPPAPYSLAAGEAAIAALFQFFGDDGWNKKESISSGGTLVGKDVSSFACVYPEIGSAYSSPGGVATTVQTETFIRAPIFCHFAQYQLGTRWRGFQEYRKSAGSACSVVPRLMALSSEKDIFNKVSPIYKFYNFDEFFETLALTVASALEVSKANNLGTTPAICPLTSQQVQILLRQTILQVMRNHIGQDLRYNSSAALDFYPFSVANNGVDYTVRGVTGMLLPQLLAENIRACCRQLKEDSNGQLHDLIPILGRYDVPQLQNYTYTDPSTSSVLPVFSTVVLPEVETPINLLSMSAVNPSAQLVYLDPNGEQIEMWMVEWNQFMQSMSANLTPLTTPGSEKGINVLNVNYFTQHSTLVLDPTPTVAATSADGVSKKRASVGEKKGAYSIGTKRKVGLGLAAPGPGSEFFQRVTCASTSSTYPINSTAWNFLKVMIKPSYIGDTGLGFEGTVSAQQVFQVEPRLLVHVPDGDGAFLVGTGYSRTVMYDQHLQMAKLDIRSGLAEEGTETERSLNALIALGRGGWFTSLAGSFLEGVGVKGAKGVADAIGSVTGW